MIDWLISKICGETLPSDDIIDWMFRTHEWLIRYEGGYRKYIQNRPLIFATPENFPIRQEGGELLAQEVFDLVRKHMRLKPFDCQLVPLVDPREKLLNLTTGISGAAGTYVMDSSGHVTIRYKPALLDNIPTFITVMAHELCHYYLRTGPGEPPDGEQAEEYATDLAVTFLGFGLFQVNNIYHQVSSYEGTSRSHQGYLGELPISYALAIFTSLRDLNADEVAAQLGPSPASYYRASLRDLKKRQRWATRLQFLRQC